MSINPTNLGTEVKLEQQGQGFWDEMPRSVALSNITLVTSNGVSEWTFDSSTDAAIIHTNVPLNYDEESDNLRLYVIARSDDTGDTIDIDSVKVSSVGGTSVTTKTISVTSGTFTTASTNEAFDFDLSGLGLTAGESLGIALGYTRAGAGTMVVSAITPYYRRNMCKTGPIKDR